SAAAVATPWNRQRTGRNPFTVSRAATRCISDVPGLAKQVSTPQLTSVWISDWAPFIGPLLPCRDQLAMPTFHMTSLGQRPPKGGLWIPVFLSSWNRSARPPSVGGDVAADDVTEQFPVLALEPHHLQLRQRREIGGRGVDLDAWQQR